MGFLAVVALGILRWPGLLICALLARRGGRLRVAAGLVALVFLLDLIVEQTTRADVVGEGGGETVTVLTNNVLFRGGDPEAAIATVLAEDADIVFLQEVSATRAEVLHAGLAARYPHVSRALSSKVGHGVVTYAKRPFEPIESWESGRGNVVGECLRFDGFTACNVHLTSPSVAFDQPRRFVPILIHNEAYRRVQWARIEAVAVAEGAPAMIVGDVNTMVVEPLFRDLRSRWVDAYRAVNPLNPGATYPHGSFGPPNAWVRPGAPFVRPDYVLLSPDIVPVAARTIDGGGSDHRPVVATVELPPR